MEIGDFTVDLELLPSQAEFVAAPERFVAFIGGVGSGKTVAGAVKTLGYALGHAGAMGLVGAPNRTVLHDVTARTLIEIAPPDAVRSFSLSKGELILTNGSQILLRSMDDYEHRRGTNLSFFWLDEGIFCGYDAWRVMKARLRQRAMPLQGWLTSTPRGRDQFFEDFEGHPAMGHRLIRGATRQNIHLPPGYVESLGYAGAFALQELEGLFVAREGLVYHLRPEHVAPAPPVEMMEDVAGGIDWGYRNPLHLCVLGRREGIVYQLAEYRAVEASRERTIFPALVALTRQFHVRTWYAGPDRPEDIAAAQDWLRHEDLPARVQGAHNAVLAGIESVRLYVESDPPRFFIDPSCAHTLAEFATYRYPDDALPGGDRMARHDEHPVKMDDHAMDSLRYALYSAWGAGVARARGAQFVADLRRRMRRDDAASA